MYDSMMICSKSVIYLHLVLTMYDPTVCSYLGFCHTWCCPFLKRGGWVLCASHYSWPQVVWKAEKFLFTQSAPALAACPAAKILCVKPALDVLSSHVECNVYFFNKSYLELFFLNERRARYTHRKGLLLIFLVAFWKRVMCSPNSSTSIGLLLDVKCISCQCKMGAIQWGIPHSFLVCQQGHTWPNFVTYYST